MENTGGYRSVDLYYLRFATMPHRCSAVNCSNNPGYQVSLYKFPSDVSLYAKWTDFVRAKRALWTPTSASRLCSDHFPEDCFEPWFALRNQFDIHTKRRILRQGAVPTIHKDLKPRSGPLRLPNIYEKPTVPTYRKRKRTAFEKRERKRIVNDLIQQLEETCIPEVQVSHSEPAAVLQEELCVTIGESSDDFSEMSPVSQQFLSTEDTLRDVTEALLLLSQAPSCGESSSEGSGEETPTLTPTKTTTVSASTGSDFAEAQEPTLRTKACQTSKKDRTHRRSVRVQTRPQVKSKGTDTERVVMVSCGIQCTLLQPPTECAVEEDDSPPDAADQFEDCERSDPLWTPDVDEDLSEVETSETPHTVQDRKFIVFESQLKKLFVTCPSCSSVTKIDTRCKGTLLTIFQDCDSCNFNRSWTSQPFIGNIPAGNILLSAAVLFSGSLPAKVFTMFRHLGLISIDVRTFFNHQRQILHPAIEKIWKSEQEEMFESNRQTDLPLVVGGDGRADSPGHNAKFGSYSMVDLNTDKVLHVQLVQSNEVKNSNAMEKEGLIRSVKLLEDKGMTVGTLVTDRHPQIQKYVRESMSETTHYYDVWHIAKGLRKKLEALSKEKDCEALAPWIRSIVNHLYWCSASTPAGETDLILDKWHSVLNHVQNVHVGHGKTFDKCLHPLEGSSVPKRKWLKSGTKVAEKLGMVLEKTHLLRDIKKLSPQYQTSSVESFHRVIISFAPKMISFSYLGILSRLYLSALHFNENGSRPQELDADGQPKFSVCYLKYKEGEHVLKKLTTGTTYAYIDRLFEEVCYQTALPAKDRQSQDHLVVPPALNSCFPRIDKTIAIQSHRSRFNKLT